MKPHKGILCRVAEPPIVLEVKSFFHRAKEELTNPHDRDPTITLFTMSDGVTIFCHEDGPGIGLPFNRNLPDIRRLVPEHLKDATVIVPESFDAPAPGEPGFHRLYGHFVLGRMDIRGRDLSLRDEDVAKYMQLLAL